MPAAAYWPVLKCEECGKRYRRVPSRARISRYCSRACLGVANGNRYRKYDIGRLIAKIKGDECVEWPGSRDRHGYGWSSLKNKSVHAHRVAYALANPGVPAPPCVLHRCDNPPCINPRHLFGGTNQDNVDDMVRKGRKPRGSKHHHAKLTEARVRVIRRSKTRSLTSFAKQFGCTIQAVSHAKKRKTWRHVGN